jgi:localization factor PodJL
MKFGVPWSVNGLRPEARATAKEAARRSGMSLGEWLDSVIIQQAGQQDVQAPLHAGENSNGSGNATVDERLDKLTRRIEQLARSGPDAYAPRRSRDDFDQRISLPHPAPPPMTPPAMPSVQLPPSLEPAVAQIATRQRALNGHAAPPRQHPQAAAAVPSLVPAVTPAPESAPAPLPSQDLSGLEDQLHKITDQIETLRTPGVEQAINALREELGEIGRRFNEAMPRHAIEAIERQILNFNERIAEGRQAGVDAHALSGIEHALAEVRDALRGLTPPENLIADNDALSGLGHKLDLFVAQRDPATLAQLENAVTTAREMATHIASNEAVQGLAAQVQALGEKIEAKASAGGYSDAVNHLEQRVAVLSETLAEREQSGATVPSRLEALLEAIAAKIEQMQNPHGSGDAVDHLEGRIVQLMENLVGFNDAMAGLAHRIDLITAQKYPATLTQLEDAITTLREMATHIAADETVQGLAAQVQALADEIGRMQNSTGNGDAFGHLEGRIVQLVEKLDASDSRLGHLESIEHGLADLLVHIEEMRTNKDAGGLRAQDASAVDDLKQDIARTQDALEAVHRTLGHVFDRLAMIEKNIRSETRPGSAADSTAPFSQPVSKLAVRPVGNAPAAAAAAPPPPPQAAPHRLLPTDTDLPADRPLEPGSGPPANPTARIAASEAALGGSQPATASGGKSSFIAAARRAAQAATQEPGARSPRPEPAAGYGSESPSPRTKIAKRVKSLFVAAGIIAIVVGSIQIAGNVFGLGKSNTRTAESPAAHISKTAAAKKGAAPERTGSVATNPLALPQLPAMPPLAAPSSSTATVTTPPQGLNQTPLSTPSLFGPPPSESKGDVTGSISRSTGNSQAARPAAPSTQPDAQLPIAIGGSRLRSAAIAGDAAAAYEVAVRFAEGRGVVADMEEAARWYERAASKGLTPAQFRYARLLEKGLGVKKDLLQARRLYLAAAAKGNSKAMHNLAVLYAEGIDGKPEYGIAVQWFRKAAQHGIADSQYNLGVLCARGLGTAKNYAEAYKWFALAAAQGDKESAKKRDDIAAQMDAPALAAAQQAVKAFVAEPQPAEATVVPAPPGGWDRTAGAPLPRAKVRPLGPLSLGTFQVGKQ